KARAIDYYMMIYMMIYMHNIYIRVYMQYPLALIVDFYSLTIYTTFVACLLACTSIIRTKTLHLTYHNLPKFLILQHIIFLASFAIKLIVYFVGVQLALKKHEYKARGKGDKNKEHHRRKVQQKEHNIIQLNGPAKTPSKSASMYVIIIH
ncbi:hypothetical protein ACJX0J_017026, partial [Zea mays]